MVSARYDASLWLRRCHGTARPSASPESLPWQGKLCAELRSFISSFLSLLPSSAPPCTAKTEETTTDGKGPSRPDCEAFLTARESRGSSGRKASLRPNCEQRRRPTPSYEGPGDQCQPGTAPTAGAPRNLSSRG